MIPADWLAQTDPQELLKHLRSPAFEKELRLFCCACCRRIWPQVVEERSRRAVEIAERYARGLAGPEELAAAENAAWEVVNQLLDRLVATPREQRQTLRIAVEASKAAAEAAICRGHHDDRAQLPGLGGAGPASPVWAAAWVVCTIVCGVVRRVRSDQPRAEVEAQERREQAALLRRILDPAALSS
jgi:hypothetical protein